MPYLCATHRASYNKFRYSGSASLEVADRLRGLTFRIQRRNHILENTVPAYRAAVTEQLPEDISGLTSREAEQALVQYGPNDPTPTRRHSIIRELLLLFLNPLIIILVIAGVVSAFLGELISAGIIIAMVLLGIAINFVQTYRSQRAVEQLRKHVMPTATVLRDRQWQDIHREDVVP